MKKRFSIFKTAFALFAVLGLSSCWQGINGDDGEPRQFSATYRPVYMKAEEAKSIKMLPAKSLISPGKIYYKDNLIYVGESTTGVHVIDNRDPKNPKNLAFLNIPGCTDISIKGNMLYAANIADLVTIDISDFNNIKVVGRVENVFPSQNVPPFMNVRFECPDASKGIIVGWERITNSENAKCFR